MASTTQGCQSDSNSTLDCDGFFELRRDTKHKQLCKHNNNLTQTRNHAIHSALHHSQCDSMTGFCSTPSHKLVTLFVQTGCERDAVCDFHSRVVRSSTRRRARNYYYRNQDQLRCQNVNESSSSSANESTNAEADVFASQLNGSAIDNSKVLEKYSQIVSVSRANILRYMTELSPKLEYLDVSNREKVLSALEVADLAHHGQLRRSGEPYIIHPIAVAAILADMQMDRDTVIAGLLHDTVEDTDMTLEALEALFGRDVRRIVEGETKLAKLASNVHSSARMQSCSGDNGIEESVEHPPQPDKQAEYLRNMFLAMTEDVRVIIVKLADRLHNMRTLQFMKPEKQKKISRETLDIFAPMAHRLGMARIKNELEELSFRYYQPEAAEQLAVDLASLKRRTRMDEHLEIAKTELREKLRADIVLRPLVEDIFVELRTKSLYAIHQKLRKGDTIDSMLDLNVFKVVIKLYPDSELSMTTEDRLAYEKNACYHILGRVHSIWKPLPGRVKDYIAFPKPNGYQCLHTSVFLESESGFFPVEIQINSTDMHRIAEEGIAAELFSSDSGAPSRNNASTRSVIQSQGDWKLRTMLWLRSIREYCDEFSEESSRDLVDAVRFDLLGNRVFVFTPKGMIIDLPKSSTPVDLAYKVHSDVGDRMIGVKVNGRFVSFDYHLQNADLVKVVTSPSAAGPSLEWLKWAKTRTARQKIRRFLRSRSRESRICHGRQHLNDVARRLHLEAPSQAAIANILPRLSAVLQSQGIRSLKSVDDLYVEIDTAYHGERSDSELLERTVLAFLHDRSSSVSPLLPSQHLPFHANGNGRPADSEAQKKLSSTAATGAENGTVGAPADGTRIAYMELASCCLPIRGDKILGEKSERKNMITVHRCHCPTVLRSLRESPERCLGLEWSSMPDDSSANRPATKGNGKPSVSASPSSSGSTQLYRSRIMITAKDCDGLLSYVSGMITSIGKSIMRSASATDVRRMATLSFEILIEDVEHLSKLVERLMSCREVLEVERHGALRNRECPLDYSSKIGPQRIESSQIRALQDLEIKTELFAELDRD